MLLLLLLTQHTRCELGSSLMHAQIVFQNSLNCAKCNSQNVTNFMNSNSSVFTEKFPCLIHVFIRFPCQWTSRAFGILKSDHTASDINIHVYIMGYQSESHVLPITCSPKATFNTLKVSVAFFSSLEQN